MAEAKSYDLAVIGGGPAGYVGAIRAAQLGMSVVCVERERLGGVCLNRGCIPTKALLAAAEFYNKLKFEARQWGIVADNVHHNWSEVIARPRTVADNLNKGIHALLKKNRITHIEGHGRIVAAGQLLISADPAVAAQPIEAGHIMVATGARPTSLPGVEFDGDRIISSTDAMVLPEQPRKLVIVGAGPIGMEFAYFYNAFGTEVVVIEMLDHLLPGHDEEVCLAIERAWRKQKIEYHVKTKTIAVNKTDSGVEITVAPLADPSNTQTIRGDKVLLAIGVQGRYDDLFCPDAASLGIEVSNGRIEVNRETYQTTLPGVYGVGDVIGPPWLAHVASEEAVVCVERMAGRAPHPIDYDAVPACTYCHPQVASLGLTEEACDEQDINYKVGKFPFQASGKAQALGSTQGFVKIIADEDSGEVLGVHMIGENVTELLAEMGLARRLEATVEEVIATMHAHPTLSEAVHEASLGAEQRTIHI